MIFRLKEVPDLYLCSYYFSYFAFNENKHVQTIYLRIYFMLITFTYKFIIIMLVCYVTIKLYDKHVFLISSIVASCSGHICKRLHLDPQCERSLIPRGLYTVAADWADISDTLTKQEKTHLKPRCTPFPGNMSLNPKTVAKRWAPVWTWTWPSSHLKFTEKRKIWNALRCQIAAIAEGVMTSFKTRFHWMRL